MPNTDTIERTARVGPSVSATEAQNNFGRVLGRAKIEGRVFVTRYDQPEAVVLSIQEYDALVGRETVDLDALEREYDEMLLAMQRPSHRAAVNKLFSTGGVPPRQGPASKTPGAPSRGPSASRGRSPRREQEGAPERGRAAERSRKRSRG